ncbi:hypothetical protein scyTo_0000847 [Scyliorhinus torazame]|uniref:Endonuclease/exonuclease/phosphatase domain-containing protein n=1 Tax=Scyliorhinus torazame TaxID=75743 RepID=A0A401P580_SCYTO|nr:hypothetical protein [Scyliorhinus torazame]
MQTCGITKKANESLVPSFCLIPGKKNIKPMELAHTQQMLSTISWVEVSIITTRLYIRHTKVTVMLIYTPEEDTEEEKDYFYHQLRNALDKASCSDIKLLVSDLNAKLDGKWQRHWAQQWESLLQTQGHLQRDMEVSR